MTTATTTVREKPILFRGSMVKAILDGRKTMTRRVVKFPERMIDDGKLPQIYHGFGDWPKGVGHEFYVAGTGNEVVECPYGAPGDHLWVRETFQVWDHDFESVEFAYKEGWPKASKIVAYSIKPRGLHNRTLKGTKPWRPSIFMPRWASRITLEIVSVRVERLQDITEEDAKAEGVNATHYHPVADDPKSYRAGFANLWESNSGKKHPWSSNPWVWVIEFKRIKP